MEWFAVEMARARRAMDAQVHLLNEINLLRAGEEVFINGIKFISMLTTNASNYREKINTLEQCETQ